jgi:hypothetical protein
LFTGATVIETQRGWIRWIRWRAYDSLPAWVTIPAGNYGEAGAIEVHGPAHGLPNAISGINAQWLRGYGNPPDYIGRNFTSCEIAGACDESLPALMQSADCDHFSPKASL